MGSLIATHFLYRIMCCTSILLTEIKCSELKQIFKCCLYNLKNVLLRVFIV